MPSVVKHGLKFPDVQFAVFNGHINNAHKRAMAVLNLLFAKDSEEFKHLKRTARSGIMNIFNKPGDPATRAYATLVFTFANGLDK